MALKMPKLFGEQGAARRRTRSRHPDDAGEDEPSGVTPSYDPLASVSIMEQLRTATASESTPREAAAHRPPAGGQAVPGARRAAGDVPRVRRASWCSSTAAQRRRAPRRTATATEMQMLSQRLARGAALAAQGQAGAFAAVQGQPRALRRRPRSVPERRHGPRRHARRRAGPELVETAERVKARWERVDTAADRLLDNERA